MKMGETGCEVVCGVPTTPAVKGQMRRETTVQGHLRTIFSDDKLRTHCTQKTNGCPSTFS